MAILNEKMRASAVADELISVTIDATDLGFGSADALRNIMSRYGRPVAARAFADFQQPGLSDLSVQLYQMGFTLVHCPTWPNGDGAPKPIVSDIMAQDLRDQLEELEGTETFLLVATSRDYIAVANAIRRHDRRVVVIAEESKVCREFRLCADEFVALPASRPERSQEPVRPARASESGRSGRSSVSRVERPVEPARVERVQEAARVERVAEPVRAERAPEPTRVERAPEPTRVERAPEPTRVERAPEPVRAEAQDQVRLPSDGEVVAEVRKIIAAEGICTPRRLARALCPVDRTPTGELRSRIANRIQSLVDSGKLLRERLVVGGTSVETILTREDRNARTVAAVPESGAAQATPVVPAVPVKETEPVDILEQVISEVIVQGEPVPEMTAEPEKTEVPPVADLDAFVESVLRGSDPFSARATPELETPPEPDPAAAVEPSVAAEPVPVPAETPAPPKRTRSRRKPSSKTPVPAESNGAE